MAGPRLLGAVAIAPLLAALALPATSTATTGPRPIARGDGAGHHVQQLRHRGPSLIDRSGRVVILHGVNAVYKHAPYVAPRSARGFTARDANFLARNGFNAVRLGVLFEGVMPRPGVIDHGYLRMINRIVQLLAARKIWVLLDFHQDAYSQKFAGEGLPAWSVHDDGIPFHNLGSFFLNDQTPAVEHTFDHFWNNDFRLWHYYTQAWRAVARRWRHQRYLMGYDLFNEPEAGTQMATCANPEGCPQFDQELEHFYNHVRRGIRRVDGHDMVWYEPQFLFNAISASHFTRVHDREVGFSWHDYACTPAFVSGGIIPGNPDCKVNEPRVMNNAARQIKQMGAGGLLTEFGAGNDLTDLTRLTRYADQHLTGWMYWAYKTWRDPTGSNQEGLFRNDARLSSVEKGKLAVLSHPYPQAIAGTPELISWKPGKRELTVRYRVRRGTGRTRVFVPRHTYRHGYVARARGATIHRAGQRARYLFLRARSGAGTVTLRMRPRAR